MILDRPSDFDALGDKVLSPTKLAHVVLRTSAERFAPMRDFWRTFLGAHVVFEGGPLAFLAYDDEHHRIALVAMPSLKPSSRENPGLEHIAFTYNSLDELLLAYRQRKARGMLPFWCVNHGPTVSFYYRDLDGNKIETQVDVMETAEAVTYMMSPEFADNSIGADLDPEDLVRRVQAGEAVESITKMPNIGHRGIETVPGL